MALRDRNIGETADRGGAGLPTVLALGLAGLAALVALSATRPGAGGQYLILWRPGVPPVQIIDRVHEAGGGTVGFGGLPGVSMAISDRADFPARIRRRGALVVLPAPVPFGCVAAAPRSVP